MNKWLLIFVRFLVTPFESWAYERSGNKRIVCKVIETVLKSGVQADDRTGTGI